MKTFLSILTALLLLGAAPALASENGRGGGGGGHGGGGHGGGGGYGGGGHPGGGGGCGGGCGGGGGGHDGGHGGGHGGGGYGGNINVNVNANANANAYAGAGAGAYINARGYDVGSVGGRGPGYGGTVVHGSGGVDIGGHGGGYVGAIVVTGAGYGPSRPFGYVAQGFGRRYVTTDRCCGLRPAPCYASACGGGHPTPPPPPPPPSCQGPCGGHDYGHSYSGRSGSSYSVRETYTDSASYAAGHRGGDRYSDRRDDGPRYAPIPYHAAPLEPVSHGPAYGAPRFVQGPPEVHVRPSQIEVAPPQVHFVDCGAPAGTACAPTDPQAYQGPPVIVPDDYYGDLPPGDTGEGMPYRQEPGERG